MEVRDPAHRQPGQVSDGDTGGLGNRYRECTDRRGLVNDQQNAAVLVQRIKDFAQPDLVVGQGLVEELLPGPVHGNGVVLALADVQADKEFNALEFPITCTSQSQQLIQQERATKKVTGGDQPRQATLRVTRTEGYIRTQYAG